MSYSMSMFFLFVLFCVSLGSVKLLVSPLGLCFFVLSLSLFNLLLHVFLCCLSSTSNTVVFSMLLDTIRLMFTQAFTHCRELGKSMESFCYSSHYHTCYYC